MGKRKSFTKGRFDKESILWDLAGLGLGFWWTYGPATWLKLKGVPGFLAEFLPPALFAKWKRLQPLSTAAVAVAGTHLIYHNLDQRTAAKGYPIWALDRSLQGLSGDMPDGAITKTLESGEKVVYYPGGVNDYVGEGEPILSDYVQEGDPLLDDYVGEAEPVFEQQEMDFA